MKRLTLALGVMVFSLSMGAMAEVGGDREIAQLMQQNQQAMSRYAAKQGKPAPQVRAYEYGMKLDIAKVVSVTPPIRACKVVPSRMTYEDSSGTIKTLEYQVMGLCRNNGS
ncbi:DUF2790 domain-containing protein [Pseudomonas sp. TAE6080]|uniref:DUF2790 domain-containing protein n=1 Tax=Pseudomonas sp. TAE6080 TaxID=2840374 RepID=UPI001C0010CF|nr:DUF2790 domain-containing protein [Pseudomonas sp. TAE6080]MBT9303587.1 DUF2790 domain-containing protein [Pseudomonas sp. TAE6080]